MLITQYIAECCKVPFVSRGPKFSIRYLFFFLYIFLEIPENKFADENSVHDKFLKKLLPLKCVINDMLLAVRVTSCRL